MAIWAYVKKYWSVAVLVVVTVLGFLFFKKEQVGFSDQLKKIQDIHDEELKKIADARAQEAKEHAANEQQLKDTLAEVQKHYDAAKQDLDATKKKEVEALVTQFSDKPDVLAQKLSDATGFKIILPS